MPLTRREFEAARLKALVNQAARRVGPSTGGETRGPRRCPRCGAANDHAARYCDQCGGHLHSSPAPVVGFAAAVRAAIARDEKASATRLAAGEGISEIEALRRVRNKSRKGGHRRQFGS
ncbi:MAG TPA: zinc ribbon domain-containing protein [Actinomycetota bacterium]|nr:zinc ribbon domain-containing protein [Actinomycetota bacterium]